MNTQCVEQNKMLNYFLIRLQSFLMYGRPAAITTLRYMQLIRARASLTSNAICFQSLQQKTRSPNLARNITIFSSLNYLYINNLHVFFALVGDSSSTNKAFALLIGPIFVGCYSHWFNISIKQFLVEHESVIQKTQSLTRKLFC